MADENKSVFRGKLPKGLRSRDAWVKMLEWRRTKQPHLHQIEPTNACPYSCMICPRSKYMTRPIGFMDMGLYQKVISEVSTYNKDVLEKEIELFHFGESLLHPQIVDMIAFAVDLDLKITLSVNAPELTPRLSEAILKIAPYKIIISLDGYDSASYKKIRGPHADYDKAVHNIKELITIQDRLKSSSEIVVRMIEFDLNKEHSNKFRQNWSRDSITVEIREFFPWSEKEMVKMGKFSQYPPFMPCPFPWQYLVVQWDGTVVPCCRDYNGVLAVGDANKETLLEIWNGAKENDLREQLRTGIYHDNPICPDCMDIYYRET